jgi:hypothetical protein
VDDALDCGTHSDGGLRVKRYVEDSKNALFAPIHTPADAWRHAATALRKTEADMRAYDPEDPYSRGMADAAQASAGVLDMMADDYDAWIGA